MDPNDEQALDAATLRRLWPNRTHESNWLKAAICALGFHRWHLVELDSKKYQFCRWCTKVDLLDD